MKVGSVLGSSPQWRSACPRIAAPTPRTSSPGTSAAPGPHCTKVDPKPPSCGSRKMTRSTRWRSTRSTMGINGMRSGVPHPNLRAKSAPHTRRESRRQSWPFEAAAQRPLWPINSHSRLSQGGWSLGSLLGMRRDQLSQAKLAKADPRKAVMARRFAMPRHH